MSSIGVCEAIVESGRLAKDNSDLRSIEFFGPLLENQWLDLKAEAEVESRDYVTVGTKRCPLGPFLQLIRSDRAEIQAGPVLATATWCNQARQFFNRRRPR